MGVRPTSTAARVPEAPPRAQPGAALLAVADSTRAVLSLPRLRESTARCTLILAQTTRANLPQPGYLDYLTEDLECDPTDRSNSLKVAAARAIATATA